MKNINELKAAIKQMQGLILEACRLNEVDEAASDKLSEEASALCAEIVDNVVKASMGQISQKLARYLLLAMPDRLVEIYNRRFC